MSGTISFSLCLNTTRWKVVLRPVLLFAEKKRLCFLCENAAAKQDAATKSTLFCSYKRRIICRTIQSWKDDTVAATSITLWQDSTTNESPVEERRLSSNFIFVHLNLPVFRERWGGGGYFYYFLLLLLLFSFLLLLLLFGFYCCCCLLCFCWLLWLFFVVDFCLCGGVGEGG